MNRHFRSTTAFTLIELLVVVSIIAVLAAILLPVLGRARDQAKRAACANNMRQWGFALAGYADTNSDWLPPRYNYSKAGNGVTANPGVADPKVLAELEKSYGIIQSLRLCPTLLTEKAAKGYYDFIASYSTYADFQRIGYSQVTGMQTDLNVGTNKLTVPYHVGSTSLAAGIPESANKITDNLKIMIADLNTRNDYVWSADILSSHMNAKGEPEGANSLYTDGHVTWFNARRLGPTGKGIYVVGNYGWSDNRDMYWGIEK